jgi:hypothetical protein
LYSWYAASRSGGMKPVTKSTRDGCRGWRGAAGAGCGRQASVWTSPAARRATAGAAGADGPRTTLLQLALTPTLLLLSSQLAGAAPALLLQMTAGGPVAAAAAAPMRGVAGAA